MFSNRSVQDINLHCKNRKKLNFLLKSSFENEIFKFKKELFIGCFMFNFNQEGLSKGFSV